MTPEEWEKKLNSMIEQREYDPSCIYCDTDNHRCSGCGESTNHKVKICSSCKEEFKEEMTDKYPIPWEAKDHVVLDGTGAVVTVCLTPAIAKVIAQNYNLNPIAIFEEISG